jgi:hypothetical protein
MIMLSSCVLALVLANLAAFPQRMGDQRIAASCFTRWRLLLRDDLFRLAMLPRHFWSSCLPKGIPQVYQFIGGISA